MFHADVVAGPAAREPVADRQPPLSVIGDSRAARTLRADLAAAVAAPCLIIEAENGLDTEDLARDVHARDPRGGPFVVVDCGAAEPGTVEYELLGAAPAEPGDLERIGMRSALARASGGTLLLLSVPELSAAAQGRLARIARDGEMEIERSVRRLDVRVIASAEGDLDLGDGRLRRDLLRHLGRARLLVPPLRDRTEDIPLLVQHLVRVTCGEMGRAPVRVSAAAMAVLAALPWRGNLVELRAAVGRIVTRVPGDLIDLEDVLSHVREGVLAANTPSGTLRQARAQFERDYILHVLRRHGWRVAEAARTLGIQRTNLYRKARQLGVALTRSGDRP
jgi:DNA-binding NtrC family response regulator